MAKPNDDVVKGESRVSNQGGRAVFFFFFFDIPILLCGVTRDLYTWWRATGVASTTWILLILLNIASQTLSTPYYYQMCEPNSNSRC